MTCEKNIEGISNVETEETYEEKKSTSLLLVVSQKEHVKIPSEPTLGYSEHIT
jgi:hypothetical protein